MQTTLAAGFKDTPQGREADSILRSCVHCGFCLATCPTYQILGDELDSPRGRIYLMKQMLEGGPVTADTQLHLDRCLTCRSCETTCPSGVKYSKLLDIGRTITEEKVERPQWIALQRYVLRKILPHRRRFALLFGVARWVRGVLPQEIRSKIPDSPNTARLPWPTPRHARKVVLLEGCVQPTLAQEVNVAAARVLDRLAISVVRIASAGCCGAVAHHMSAHEETLQQIRNNVDAIWPHIQLGAEAVVMTASACTAMLTDYGSMLAAEPAYAERARRITALARDMSEVVLAERQALGEALRTADASAKTGPKVAFQSPCTLQHALKVRGPVESLLEQAGFTLTHVPDSHLCCGSAGTYSILQPELSARLLSAKVATLEQGQAALIATANIGCHIHIRSGTTVPVHHWVELIAARLDPPVTDQNRL
jgi:glycolate dehydrogenase iron-sulfur subunit